MSPPAPLARRALPAGSPPGAPGGPRRRLDSRRNAGALRVPPHSPAHPRPPVTPRRTTPKGERETAPKERKPRRKRARAKAARKGKAPFEERLVARLAQRGDTGAFTLDLRGRAWEGVRPEGCSSYLTLRNPGSEGWPLKGPTTDQREVAEVWVREAYGPWLARREQRAERGPASSPTITEAADAYLSALEEERGADHNTVVNRRSACEVHIKPALGTLPLDSLSKQRVRRFLEGLRVRKRAGGLERLVAPTPGTRATIYSTLLAIWYATHPDDDGEPPFAGIRFGGPNASRRRRDAAESGDHTILIETRAYTRAEILHLLAQARRYDREVLARPQNRARSLANTAPGIAFIAGTGARVEEATFVRWKHVHEHTIYIPGTKSHNAPRWVPRQQALEPWLHELREAAGGSPDPEAFVLRMNRPDPLARATQDAWYRRIAKVEMRAGLKHEGKGVHILRATHLSWARDHLPEAALKTYAGHGRPHGGATDVYMDTRAPFIPPRHRDYLDLPGPVETDLHLATARSDAED